jgi:hypothetical protein
MAAGEGGMILFRRISRKERWQERRGRMLLLAAAGLAALLAFDLLSGGVARRALAEAVRLAAA